MYIHSLRECVYVVILSNPIIIHMEYDPGTQCTAASRRPVMVSGCRPRSCLGLLLIRSCLKLDLRLAIGLDVGVLSCSWRYLELNADLFDLGPNGVSILHFIRFQFYIEVISSCDWLRNQFCGLDVIPILSYHDLIWFGVLHVSRFCRAPTFM